MKSQTLEIPTLIAEPPVRSLPRLQDITLPPTHKKAGYSNRCPYYAQIQFALVKIGQQLGFRTWVAKNHKGIVYQDKKLGEMDGVIARLENETLLASHTDAIRAALLIDCIWFKNSRLMPAVIEVEHSTGVTSGLTRMQGFKEAFPPFPTRWVIAAPDEDRDKVMTECNRPQFHSLNAQFFPYSAVEELYSLCQRRKIKGVTEEFLDCFMEPCRKAITS